MPFIGRDWRSPGEAWVKTESLGWQRLKTIESQSSSPSECQQLNHPACSCRISVRTREVAMHNTISEALYRLDFCNAIRDIRRFNYICKLLHLLITQNLTSLSGCATKILLTMLEQIAWEAAANKRNIHVIKNLINELKQMIQKYYCWGRPIGSSVLWQQHFDTIERISRIVDGIELSPTPNKAVDRHNQLTLDKLPIEMIQEILLRLNDHRDLVNSTKVSPVIKSLVDGQHIWQQLCRYHFSEQQIKLALEQYESNLGKRSPLKGLKYARTTSADGRRSYRNPTASSGDLSNQVTRHMRKAINPNAERNQQQDSSSAPSCSLVSRTIKIFDDKFQPQPTKQDNKSGESIGQNAPGVAERQQSRELCEDAESDHSSRKIDWELVFHQLRKKYDLREEYADCLLLCRHCQCLFWKSIGHPCVLNANEPSTEIVRENQISSSNNSTSRSRPTGAQNLDNNSEPNSNYRRPSVAWLSRNFDNIRSLNGRTDRENIPPRMQPNRNSRRNSQGENNQRFVQGMNINGNDGRASYLEGRRDNLVPKHITISPQAFLKFFSL